MDPVKYSKRKGKWIAQPAFIGSRKYRRVNPLARASLLRGIRLGQTIAAYLKRPKTATPPKKKKEKKRLAAGPTRKRPR